MRDGVYMPVDNNGRTLRTVPLEMSEKISLLDPQTVEKPFLVQRPVIRQGRVVMQVEVLAFRQAPPK